MKDTIYDLIDGRWHFRLRPPSAAVVAYCSEPSPETGHIGWCWWAAGRMGDAETLEDAKRAAEAVVESRKGR